MFGSPIGSEESLCELAISTAMSRGQSIDVQELIEMTRMERAIMVSQTTFHRNNHLVSLVEHFHVSKSAMAIQLLDCGLVS
jgi:hypothetical protein